MDTSLRNRVVKSTVRRRIRVTEDGLFVRMFSENLNRPNDLLTANDDFVFSKMPCVFLEEDNTCKIYEDRPRACREYPHTDQRKIHQVLDITLKNMSTCPAVFEIVERLKKVKI